MDADGSNPTRLTNNNANDESPIWSPDGTYIAFTSDRNGYRNIYVMNANGGFPTPLLDSTVDQWAPAWSPDSRRITWVYGRESDGDGSIYVQNMASNGYRIESSGCWDPVWSPDGRYIAYVDRCHIYVETEDARNRTRIFGSSGCSIQATKSPVWSPNGRRIAFYFHGPGPNFDIYVTDADGQNLTRLTEHAADDESPVWSPNGLHLAFISDREGNLNLYVMDADGGNLTQLTEHAADDESPVWSPDGSQIAFVSFRLGNREIYVVDVD